MADTSLPVDRGTKLPLYARAGIAEVWIVDLTTDSVEIHREPEDARYLHTERLASGRISPVALPQLELEIATMLPAVC